jgi:hypothetical protein
MTQEVIDIGVIANDGTGDPLRIAFDKINNNFDELYNSSSVTGPNGAVQFAIANTIGNVTSYALESSANFVFNSTTNSLSMNGNLLPLSNNAVNLGAPTSTIGNLYLSNNGYRLGNITVNEQNGTLNFSVTGSNIGGNIRVGDIIAGVVTLAELIYANTVLKGDTATTVGNTQGQLILSIPENEMVSGKFDIKSQSTNTANNQSTTMVINKNSAGTNIRFSVSGTTFNGAPITSYNVDLAFGQIRILVNPLVTDTIVHTLSYQLTK